MSEKKRFIFFPIKHATTLNNETIFNQFSEANFVILSIIFSGQSLFHIQPSVDHPVHSYKTQYGDIDSNLFPVQMSTATNHKNIRQD